MGVVKTHGTCNQCGGRVTTPRAYMSVVPPIPTCERCGATKKQPHGAVIEMEPRKADLYRELHIPIFDNVKRQ